MGWSKSEEVSPLIHAIARSSLARDEQREIFVVFVSVLEDLDFDVWDELEGADMDFDYVMRQKGLIGEEGPKEEKMVEISATELAELRRKAQRWADENIPF
jgi:hypothetical protein